MTGASRTALGPALHKKSNEMVREAVSEPEAVATGSSLARKRQGSSLTTVAVVDERPPGRHRFRF